MKDHYHYFGVFYLFVGNTQTFTNGYSLSIKKLNRNAIRDWEVQVIENSKEILKKENVVALLKDFKEISCDCRVKNERN